MVGTVLVFVLRHLFVAFSGGTARVLLRSGVPAASSYSDEHDHERMVERMRAHSAATLALPMFIALTACAVRPPMVTRDDATITSDVQARLAADPQTKPFAITVDTKAGVVHVAGDVAKDADRQAVERIAHDAPGVQGVDNNVRYGSVPVAAEPSAD